MADEATRALLDRFAADISEAVPLTALWAHGSLALGDYVRGRSDLDIVALIEAPVDAGQRQDLQRIHESLIRDEPLAGSQAGDHAGLHCAYLVESERDDPGRSHLTWAHAELFERPVSLVSRRELHQGGLCLLGPAPALVLPAVTDAELADFIRSDLRDYWYPHTSMADLWLHDIWVDLGMLTLARATVTLRDGRLITKREALDVLTAMGAPTEVVADIRLRRYATAQALSAERLADRGARAAAFVRRGIDHALDR